MCWFGPWFRTTLSKLGAGGDFADGVIAMAGRALGADRLATFDKTAASLMEELNQPVMAL